MPGTHHGGLRGEHAPDGGQGLFRLALLDKPDDGVDHHYGDDHAGVHPMGKGGGDNSGGKEGIDEDAVELQQQPHQRAAALALGESIGSEFGQAISCFLGREALRLAVQVRHDGRGID